MFKHDPDDTKPCTHMRMLVSSLADNQLSGLPRLFTEQHVKGCLQCQHGLSTLQAMRRRLSTLDAPDSPLPSPHRAGVEAAWDKIDEDLDPSRKPAV